MRLALGTVEWLKVTAFRERTSMTDLMEEAVTKLRESREAKA